MANRLKLIAAVVLVVIAIPAGHWVRRTRPWESPTERVHRLCRECGLYDDEINRLIDTKKNAGLTQRELGARLGKPQSWVYNCDTANRRVDVTEFIAWCKACGVKPTDAFARVLRTIRR